MRLRKHHGVFLKLDSPICSTMKILGEEFGIHGKELRRAKSISRCIEIVAASNPLGIKEGLRTLEMIEDLQDGKPLTWLYYGLGGMHIHF